MPICINLLAEQQAAEALRRRDPVKRAIWIGGFLVGLMLLWGGFLQFRIVRANSALAGGDVKWKAIEKDTRAVSEHLKQTAETERKLSALQALATNRFLWAVTLNALQNTIVDNVQLVRFRADQNYAVSKHTGEGKTARPAMSKERITLTLEARDYANPAELNHNKFISAISTAAVFQAGLRKVDGVTLKDRMPPQPDSTDPTKNYILFSIECRYPEKERTL